MSKPISSHSSIHVCGRLESLHSALADLKLLESSAFPDCLFILRAKRQSGAHRHDNHEMNQRWDLSFGLYFCIFKCGEALAASTEMLDILRDEHVEKYASGSRAVHTQMRTNHERKLK